MKSVKRFCIIPAAAGVFAGVIGTASHAIGTAKAMEPGATRDKRNH